MPFLGSQATGDSAEDVSAPWARFPWGYLLLLGLCPDSNLGFLLPQVWGFYRGLSLPVCTVSLVSSLSFGTYRHCLARICRARYGSADAKPAKTDVTLAGFASGLVRVSRAGGN